MLTEKREHLWPQVECRRFPIAWTIVGEKCVAGILENFDLIILARLFESPAQLSGVGRRGILILFATHDVEWTVQSRRQFDHRCRTLGRGRRVGRGARDEAAPAIDGGVPLVTRARKEQGPATAHAEA